MSGIKSVTNFFLFFMLFCFLAKQPNGLAATFSVSNISEFQTALSTAATNSENDTIKVASGNYNVNSTIRFWSDQEFSLLIKGEYSPVLDGGNATQIMELITVSQAGSIFIDGLIFQHGRADYGGGLYAETESADISLTNCSFIENSANYVCGGANLYSITGNITVTNCTFRNNTSPNTSGYPYGTAGGLFVQTEGEGPTIKLADSVFEDNFAHRDGAGAMLYPLGYKSAVIVKNNRFSGNIANEFGGGCWIRCPSDSSVVEYRDNIVTENSSAKAGSGAGTYIQTTSGTINFINNSHVGNNSIWQGGGLWIEHGGGMLTIQNSEFDENSAAQNGGGANIFIENGAATIDHNVFNKNESSESGGGICLSTTSANLDIFNNTFYANNAPDGGDIYLYFDSPASDCRFYNNILWASSSPALSFSGQQTVVATYSDIDGGAGESWFGTGCIDADPKFADANNGDFHLTWENFPANDATKSPCIDAGDPASALDPDGSIADMGAFYFEQATKITEKTTNSKTSHFRLQQNYPNPFNSATLIRYSLAEPAHVKISIFNLKGQLVQQLVDKFYYPGSYSVLWDATNFSSGVFLYQLKANNFTQWKKLIYSK